MWILSFGDYSSEIYVSANRFCTRVSKNWMVTKGKSKSREEEHIIYIYIYIYIYIHVVCLCKITFNEGTVKYIVIRPIIEKKRRLMGR